MGTPEEHHTEEVKALREEVAALTAAVAGVPAMVKAAIDEAFPVVDESAGDEHKIEPA